MTIRQGASNLLKQNYRILLLVLLFNKGESLEFLPTTELREVENMSGRDDYGELFLRKKKM